jgi:hypothetical protein
MARKEILWKANNILAKFTTTEPHIIAATFSVPVQRNRY